MELTWSFYAYGVFVFVCLIAPFLYDFGPASVRYVYALASISDLCIENSGANICLES